MDNTNKGIVPYVLHGHTRPISSICFNEDSDLLFAACADDTLSIWWSHNATPARVLKGHEGALTSVTVSCLLFT